MVGMFRKFVISCVPDIGRCRDSFENEKNITEGDGAWAASLVSKCHDTKSELKILN